MRRISSTFRPLAFVLVSLSGLGACAGPLDGPGMVSAGPMAPDPIPPADPADQRGLEAWLEGFRPRALAAGIAPETLDRALRGVRYNPKVIERDRNQAEFTKPIWDYLDSAVSDTRIANGRAMLARHRALLDAIEAQYGVDREVVVAIWGMESNYGNHRGNMLLIPSLATLAYDGRRGAFFESQLIAALRIVQTGDVDPARMTGSWAGAMGHTQFIPTSYLAYAVDFTGDGKRDIWSENPADALASTAAYLARSGWVKGQPWGVEVRLPAGFDTGLAGKKRRRSTAEWSALGLRTAQGRALVDHGPAALLLPAGAKGPAFLIFGNFRAIARYNAADAYVIGVGHLSDRLRGKGPIVAPWPRTSRPLTEPERIELQRRLTAAGYDTGGVDGLIGSQTMSAIGAFQRARGLPVDGYPSVKILEMLR